MGFLCSLRLAIPSAALSLTFCPLREANRAPRVRDCACIPCPGQAGSPQGDTITREEAWTQFLPQIPACTFPAPNCKVWPLLASCTPLQMKACLRDLPLETLRPILSKGFRVEIRALCSVTMGKSVSSSEHCLRNGNNILYSQLPTKPGLGQSFGFRGQPGGSAAAVQTLGTSLHIISSPGRWGPTSPFYRRGN